MSNTTEEIENCGKKPGLQIWRIEQMQLVPVPKNDYGSFFTGDSYILLKTTESKGGKLSWVIHFWIGSQSSQDEQGAAAILSVQIDDKLGGGPIQRREIQDHESASFMAYFKNGIKYKSGGVASGFNHARTNVSDVKRVLRVKGRRNVRAKEMPMSWKSFNKGDVFIVEVENDIFQWNGSESNVHEKLKACQVAKSIRDSEKGGKGKIHIVEEGQPIPKIMAEALSGSPSDVAPATSDEAADKTTPNLRATLYRISTDSGSLVIKEVATAPFRSSALDSGDCFILSSPSNRKMFVWKGRLASKTERKAAISNALQFIKDKNFPDSTQVEILAEGAESVLFTQFFRDWKKKDETVGLGKAHTFNKIAKIDKTKFDVKALYEAPQFAAQQGMVDDGSGKVEVWRVEGSDLAPVKADDYGLFFSGDCYIILYTYKPRNREEFIIYCWQGLTSSKDEITASAFLATQLDDKYGQIPVQCRVVQGKEPKHLLSIFHHPLIIMSGGYDKAAGKNVGVSSTALYQVRSTAAGGTKLIEVELTSSQLNSNDAFLLKDGQKGYIWIGLGASEDEVDAARYGAEKLGARSITDLKEGSESDAFWKILGGKKDYANSPRLQEDMADNPPRLFAISNATGRISVEEVPGEFTQSDLETDDVMMLDTWDSVFIWIGEGANNVERTEASDLVKKYIKEDPRGRDADCPVTTIKQGAEPVNFIGFFPSWDNEYFSKQKSYAERMRSIYG